MSALSELYQEIALCQQCEIAKYRNKVVPGEGAENAQIMFIGLKREQVYIANVIKCRPSSNRDPLPTEIQNCRQWLEHQIEIIHPKMIVTLGRYSMAMFFPGKSISKIHGTAQKHGDTIYYAMYHPAAALHQASLRRDIEEDMLKIPSLLAKTETIKEEEKQPEQLSMF
jgi:uracil-DNA glycosylase